MLETFFVLVLDIPKGGSFTDPIQSESIRVDQNVLPITLVRDWYLNNNNWTTEKNDKDKKQIAISMNLLFLLVAMSHTIVFFSYCFWSVSQIKASA